jgi:hypothetical protein
MKHPHLSLWLAAAALSSAILLAGCGSGSGSSFAPRDVQVSAIDSYYGAQGKVDAPEDLSSKFEQIAALVPEADGSITTIPGIGMADGTCTIPHVPAGYYWLQQTTGYSRNLFWTNSSTFDLGGNSTGRPWSGQPVNTTFELDLTGLYPVPNDGTLTTSTTDALILATPNQSSLGLATFSLDSTINNSGPDPGTTTFSGSEAEQVMPPDLSKGDAATYLYQMAPVPSAGLPGGWYGLALTTALALPNFTVNADGNTAISGAMSQSNPAALNFNIDGPSWGTATGWTKNSPIPWVHFDASVQPFLTTSDSGNGIDLITLDAYISSSAPANIFQNVSATIDYDNPFPSSWPKVYEIWVLVPAGGPGNFANNYSSYRTTTFPASFTPQIGPVRNPTINGANLQNPPAIANPDTPVTLSWLPPTGPAPNMYEVGVYALATNGTNTNEIVMDTTVAFLVTPQTSVTIPAGLLEAGNTYYLTIGAQSAAGFTATSPYRQGFPNAYTSIASGTFAVGSAPATPAFSTHRAVATSMGKVRILLPGANGQIHAIPQPAQTQIP